MADPGTPNGWDIAVLAAGAATVLGVLGKGVSWLLSWGDRRQQARLDRLAREEGELAEGWSAFRKRITTELHEAQEMIVELRGKIAELEQRDIVRTRDSAARQVAFDLVHSALHAIDPGNIALLQADQILSFAYPVTPPPPPDMTRTLGEIDAADERN